VNRLPIAVLAAVVLAGCARDDSAAMSDTVAMPPVDGSIPLVSPGSVPALTERAQSPADRSAVDVGGIDTTTQLPVAEPPQRLDADTPRRDVAPVPPPDTAGPDSIIGRDSAHTGPFLPVPVAPDTGHEH
jgi:hypothetical protein